MKILVLGNGFDIDHNLPTSYSDFLNFCECLLSISDPKATCFSKLSDKQIPYFERLRREDDLRKKFLELLQNNYLLTLFLTRREKQGNNWIDLEREIKNVVNEFRSIEYLLVQSSQVKYVVDKDHRINQVVRELGLSAIESDAWDETLLAAMHKTLCTHHELFSKALELYISEFVNKTTIQGVSPDIIDFSADSVLTFNYSNTYERIYGGVKWGDSIAHIHGLAQCTLDSDAHIILGITSVEEWAEKSYVEFEKYYQRITKRTGMEQTKWLATKLRADEKLEVAFFGHSLDASDSDIINDFLCHQKASVTIYYYNENAYQQIVANLIKILGKAELINCVSGANPKITFKQQRSHENTNNAGLEIARDIRTLFRMYSMNSKDIIQLINKVALRIYSKDTTYFHSQRKAISLFDALRYLNLERNANAIKEICSLLPYETNESGNLIIYDFNEWNDFTPWGDLIGCAHEIMELVNSVNKKNTDKYQADVKASLFQQVPLLPTSDDMARVLKDILSESNPSASYLKSLSSLANELVDNSLISDALAKLKKDKLPVPTRIRLQHFENTYEEYSYNNHLMKEMADWYSHDENE